MGEGAPVSAAASDEDGWTAVCPAVDLGATPRNAWVDGRQIVVWRTERGALVALNDSCPHQGGALSAGVVVGDRIRCPVHGWEVASDGWCDRAGAGVASHPVEERDGTIFIKTSRRR